MVWGSQMHPGWGHALFLSSLCWGWGTSLTRRRPGPGLHRQAPHFTVGGQSRVHVGWALPPAKLGSRASLGFLLWKVEMMVCGGRLSITVIAQASCLTLSEDSAVARGACRRVWWRAEGSNPAWAQILALPLTAVWPRLSDLPSLGFTLLLCKKEI